MKLFLTSFLCAICIATSYGQALPASNIYYFTFLNQNQSLKINKALYLSNFNGDGYNNQASFIDDNNILLTSDHYDKTQTDIIKLNLLNNTMKRLTNSDESEYSPIYHSKLRAMSTVKVNKKLDHHLHIYKTNGFNQGYTILEDENKIDYYLWDPTTANMMYVVTTGKKLLLLNTKTGDKKIILENVGRTLKINENGLLYFVHKVADDAWYIKTYDVTTGKINLIVRTLNKKEDFELIKGTIISGSGALIYQHVLGQSKDWVRMADLSPFGLRNITRLQIRKNKLLVIDKSRA